MPGPAVGSRAAWAAGSIEESIAVSTAALTFYVQAIAVGGGMVFKPFYLDGMNLTPEVGNAVFARKSRFGEIFGLLARGAVGATSITWWNWLLISPCALMRSGQCKTMPLRVPPKWLATCLVH